MAGSIGKLAESGAMTKMMDGQKGKGSNPMHARMANDYGVASDLSQLGSMQSLLNMAGSMSQPAQQVQPGQAEINQYLRSLLGG